MRWEYNTITVEFNNGICTTKGFVAGKMSEAKINTKMEQINA